MGGERIHGLLLPSDIHERGHAGAYRSDTGTGGGGLSELQGVHDLDTASESADAGQQDGLRAAGAHHGEGDRSPGDADDPFRRRRHGAFQLRERPGGRALGLVEYAPHTQQPVRGRVFQAGASAGEQDGVRGVFRSHKRDRGGGGGRAGADAGDAGVRRDAAQLRLLQRGELPRGPRDEVPHLPVAEVGGRPLVAVAGASGRADFDGGDGPGVHDVGGEDAVQDGGGRDGRT